MTTKEKILLESKAWRQEKLSLDPEYFKRLNGMRHPKILWISSADSLVSIRDMTNTEPGDITVYRNIGTQIRQDDISMMAILEDAIELDNIKHIIVCGYSQCTGIREVLKGKQDRPAMKEWLKHLHAIYDEHYDEIKDLTPEFQEKFLSEANIRAQVQNLSRFPVIQKAWARSDYPRIFGWYFDLQSGTFQEVFSMEENRIIKQTSTLVEDASRIKIPAS